MSYTANSGIMHAVKRLLPSGALRIFLKAANASADAGSAHNEAMLAGWDAVKDAGYERGKTGRWVRKDEPGASDVHVNAPMPGGKKSPKKFPKAPAPFDQQTVQTQKVADLLTSVAKFLSADDERMAQVDKVIGSTVKDYIDDFINSDAPQFRGKSKEERIQMALAAWYGGKAADSVELTVPMLLRLMEYAREDAPDDLVLHTIAERVAEKGSVEAADYPDIVPQDDENVEKLDGSEVSNENTPVDPADLGGGKQTLYVHRPLINGADLQDWAKQQGFASMVPPDELHTTLAYSRQPFDTSSLTPDQEMLVIPANDPNRSMAKFGDASVLRFDHPAMQDRFQQFQKAGASWDHGGFKPHMTITYNGGGLDHDAIEPYTGPLIFGPEQFAPIPEKEWTPDNLTEDTVKSMQIVKIDQDERMVYGWASVISENGSPYVDSQGDMISPQELHKATTDFMMDVRRALAMHERNQDGGIDETMIKGIVVHSFPIIGPIAKSLGIEAAKEGWIVGLKINDDHTWQLVKDGKLRAFSIGGQGQRVPA